jgi:predicted acetyltransferase
MVSLRPIGPEQAHVLRNLFELYCYDFSDKIPLELNPSGRFDYPIDASWWTSEDAFPFFVDEAERLIGFALARRGSRVGGPPDTMDVAEFFIVRGARRRGAGLAAARALLTRFPAVWEIRVRDVHPDAQKFWTRVGEDWSSRRDPWEPFVAERGDRRYLLRVDSRR